jgi:hypothetical protein
MGRVHHRPGERRHQPGLPLPRHHHPPRPPPPSDRGVPPLPADAAAESPTVESPAGPRTLTPWCRVPRRPDPPHPTPGCRVPRRPDPPHPDPRVPGPRRRRRRVLATSRAAPTRSGAGSPPVGTPEPLPPASSPPVGERSPIAGFGGSGCPQPLPARGRPQPLPALDTPQPRARPGPRPRAGPDPRARHGQRPGRVAGLKPKGSSRRLAARRSVSARRSVVGPSAVMVPPFMTRARGQSWRA